jgi:hypothetical protein
VGDKRAWVSASRTVLYHGWGNGEGARDEEKGTDTSKSNSKSNTNSESRESGKSTNEQRSECLNLMSQALGVDLQRIPISRFKSYPAKRSVYF